jgi:hypothetical protein
MPLSIWLIKGQIFQQKIMTENQLYFMVIFGVFKSILDKIFKTNTSENPAFSTVSSPIFKCKYLCIGTTYSGN